MQLYRNLDDDLHTQHYKDGLNRCNRALKKSGKDALLHLYRARFLRALGQNAEAEAAIKALADPTFRLQDTAVLEEIDTFLMKSDRDDSYPPSLSNGAESNKLWANLAGTTPRQYHVPMHKDRYTHAVLQQRWVDAGYALSNWRRIEPNRKDLRFAHIAVYQLIAEVSKDEMTIRMNTQLADRTLQSLLDNNITPADFKLMIKVFSRQKSFSRHPGFLDMFYPLLMKDCLSAVALVEALKEAQDWEQLLELTNRLLTPDKPGVTELSPTQRDVASDWRVWEGWLLANQHINSLNDCKDLVQLATTDRTGELARLWIAYKSCDWTTLMAEIKAYFDRYKSFSFCFSALREFLLALPSELQPQFRLEASASTRNHIPDESLANAVGQWVCAEATSLRIDHLLTIGQAAEPPIDHIYAFIQNALRLQTFVLSFDQKAMIGFPELLVSSLLRASEVDGSEDHLLLALNLLYEFWSKIDGAQIVLLVQLYAYFGLYGPSLGCFRKLSVKEVQMETVGHLGLTRISIGFPSGIMTPAKSGAGPQRSVRELLTAALQMFEPTIAKIADQQCMLLDCSRFDLLLELEELRKSLEHSLNRRLMILELRRLDRLTNITPTTKYMLHPAVVEMWTDDLRDARDFTTCDHYDAGTNTTNLTRRLQDNGAVPDADWIRYHLWIDEVCSLSYGEPLLVKPFLDSAAATSPVDQSTAFTREEKAMVSFWKALAAASTAALGPDQDGATPKSSKGVISVFEELQSVLNGLTVDAIIPPTDGQSMLPMGSTIQAILLQMDFLKAVARLGEACTKVASIKTSKQTLNKLVETAKMHFDKLRKYALERRAKLDAVELAKRVEKLKTMVMATGNAHMASLRLPQPHLANLSEWKSPESTTKTKQHTVRCHDLVYYAQESWDSVLRIKFAQ